MIKTQDQRSIFILVVMLIIIILFFVYLFVPFGEKEKNEGKSDLLKKKAHKTIKKSELKLKEEKSSDNLFYEFNLKIEDELKKIYKSIIESNEIFINYKIERLKEIINGPGIEKKMGKDQKDFVEILNRLKKISFFDLNEIKDLGFPESIDKRLKFNIYVSMFLIKIKEEEIFESINELSNKEFGKIIDLRIFDLINNEINKDFQVLPILFYFDNIVKRINVYSNKDSFTFFKEGMKNIKDLSLKKSLMKMRDLLNFSYEFQNYRIEWTEYDMLDPNDMKVYTNLKLKTFHFLKQYYLVFPDIESKSNNIWIKDLCKSDSGDIELIRFKILAEDPSQNLKIKKILYSEDGLNFIVLLKEFKRFKDNGFFNRIIENKLELYLKNFKIVDFSEDKINKELFKDRLEEFGDYLKRNIYEALE
jgi:hypothetical protein